ncbi:hypothetical protein DRE_06685 [Drechslerella stenobrocha 248]|uniref:Ricin B lectin domain-containing protein n=1 Tax=Drechslerella stenobrocha 248 TaxID=1043628 RepID=W7HN96_9PEZI|nr:hypothetical protein DRE_06685 [Drechslerella stenobrocha 248]
MLAVIIPVLLLSLNSFARAITIAISTRDGDTSYCLRDPGDSSPIATLEPCDDNNPAHRWRVAGTVSTRLEPTGYFVSTPFDGGAWLDGRIESQVTNRCIYAQQGPESSFRASTRIDRDGYQAFGLLYLADCNSNEPAGVADAMKIEINPFVYSLEFTSPTAPLPPTGANSTDDCPPGSSRSLLVPHIAPESNNVGMARWGCAKLSSSTISRIAQMDPSPRRDFVRRARDATECPNRLWTEMKEYNISLCQYYESNTPNHARDGICSELAGASSVILRAFKCDQDPVDKPAEPSPPTLNCSDFDDLDFPQRQVDPNRGPPSPCDRR